MIPHLRDIRLCKYVLIYMQTSLHCNIFCVKLDQFLNKAEYGGLTSDTMCLCVISQQYWNDVTCMTVLNIQAHALDL